MLIEPKNSSPRKVSRKKPASASAGKRVASQNQKSEGRAQESVLNKISADSHIRRECELCGST